MSVQSMKQQNKRNGFCWKICGKFLESRIPMTHLLVLLTSLAFLGHKVVSQETTAAATTAFNYNFLCGTNACPSQSYSYYIGYVLFCWSYSSAIPVLTSCNGTDLVPFASQDVPDIRCYGYLNFAIGTTNYWFNGTTYFKQATGGTFTNIGANVLDRYIGRLRVGEGTGWAYCESYVIDSETPLPFFYDGTGYFKLRTDADGKVSRLAQTTEQGTIPMFFTYSNNDGCTTPICCWFQDFIPGTSTFTEFIYNATGWLVYLNNRYSPYNGEFNDGIRRCAMFFNKANFTDPEDRDTEYYMYKGVVYDTDGMRVVSNVDWLKAFLYDPEAAGYVYHRDPNSPYNGIYANESGLFWVNIASGAFQYQRIQPRCSDKDNITSLGVSGNPYPYCVPTVNRYESFLYQTCDPTAVNPCSQANYFCPPMSSVYEFPAQCTKAVCIPDYFNQVCPTVPPTTTTTLPPDASTTTTTTTTSTSTTTTSPASSTRTTPEPEIPMFKKFGQGCTAGTDCYTGFCWNGVCTCTNCTKFLAGIEYKDEFRTMIYTESCIPINATVGGAGDPCDMWASVPSAYCGFGMTCMACPETWDSPYFQSTCIPFSTFMNTNNKTCPRWSSCGYKANCTMIGGVMPSCVCPRGYNLEPNLVDCYGWAISQQTECNVYCGNGVKTTVRYCDKKAGSVARCDGNGTTIVEPCVGELGQCPVNDTMRPAAVLIGFASKIVTVDLFRSKAIASIRAELTTRINTECTSNSATYQNQCCPGKIYPSAAITPDCVNAAWGVQISTPYTNGAYFTFYIFVQADIKSQCCTIARDKVYYRKKRATVTYHFDQAVVQSVMQRDMINPLNTILQAIDPSVRITNTSIQSFTTTTASTDAVTQPIKTTQLPAASTTVDTIAAVAGVLAGVLAAAVIGMTFFCMNKRHKQEVHIRDLLRKKKAPAEPEMTRKPMVGTGDTQRQVKRGISATNVQVSAMGTHQTGYQMTTPPPDMMMRHDGMNLQLQQADPNMAMMMMGNMQLGGYPGMEMQMQGQYYPPMDPMMMDPNYPAYYGQYPPENGMMVTPKAAHGY